MRRGTGIFGLLTPLVGAMAHHSRDRSWALARETDIATMRRNSNAFNMGRSPQPTMAPELVGPAIEARMAGYTLSAGMCGYEADGVGWGCLSESTCHTESSHIGCCPTAGKCDPVHTTCVEYDIVQDGGCGRDLKTLCCAYSTAPYCNSAVLQTTYGGDTIDATWLICDTESSAPTFLLDYNPSWAATHSFPPTTTSSTATSSTTTSGAEIGNHDETSEASGKHKKNIGPIVGGVLGGVAVIAIIAVLTLFLRRKSKPKPSKNGSDMITFMSSPDSQPQSHIHGGPNHLSAAYAPGAHSSYGGSHLSGMSAFTPHSPDGVAPQPQPFPQQGYYAVPQGEPVFGQGHLTYEYYYPGQQASSGNSPLEGSRQPTASPSAAVGISEAKTPPPPPQSHSPVKPGETDSHPVELATGHNSSIQPSRAELGG